MFVLCSCVTEEQGTVLLVEIERAGTRRMVAAAHAATVWQWLGEAPVMASVGPLDIGGGVTLDTLTHRHVVVGFEGRSALFARMDFEATLAYPRDPCNLEQSNLGARPPSER